MRAVHPFGVEVYLVNRLVDTLILISLADPQLLSLTIISWYFLHPPVCNFSFLYCIYMTSSINTGLLSFAFIALRGWLSMLSNTYVHVQFLFALLSAYIVVYRMILYPSVVNKHTIL